MSIRVTASGKVRCSPEEVLSCGDVLRFSRCGYLGSALRAVGLHVPRGAGVSRFFDPRPTPEGGLHAPATQRNKDAITEVLAGHLPARGLVLETASGTGEHVVHLAAQFPQLEFQPTDPDPLHLQSIEAWRQALGLTNVRAPVFLDVTLASWPVDGADALLNINMIHISPWQACLALMAGASRTLRPGGLLYLYGPYKRDGEHTAPSNAAFDESLKRSNPAWGVRDLEAVVQAASAEAFELVKVVPMPANNFSLLFERR